LKNRVLFGKAFERLERYAVKVARTVLRGGSGSNATSLPDNPDEVVALGAAIQAGVLGGEVQDMLLLDVTPLSLGLETLGGVMTPLIPRNTTIPTRKAEVFSTAEDSQTAVDVHVLQGERPMARDNKTLGMFRLEGIPPTPRGLPQIEVTFDIDANGILNVTAKDKATGKEQKIQITASTNLSEVEVEKMISEAKQHESEDERQRQLIETRNQADQLIYTVEKTLNELGDKVSATDRGQVENVMNDLKEALKTDDAARIRSLTEQLQQASYAFSQQMYETQQPTQTNGSTNGSTNGQSNGHASGQDDDVIEGEFQEMNDG
jgi:molecular chaperone DnaK